MTIHRDKSGHVGGEGFTELRTMFKCWDDTGSQIETRAGTTVVSHLRLYAPIECGRYAVLHSWLREWASSSHSSGLYGGG
jgi:hypothetical protein